VQYTFWQFLTPIFSNLVRNPGKAEVEISEREAIERAVAIAIDFVNKALILLLLCIQLFNQNVINAKASANVVILFARL
jgi:hypothetical protein